MEQVMGKKKHPFFDDEAMDPNITLPGLGLPEHINSRCKKHFFAADEDNKKGETLVFSDTGLMAMVCQHDRVLFMVNLWDPGEKRYYALALLKRLFQELPASWTAGVLYDIGCQLHQTITKVGFSYCLRNPSHLLFSSYYKLMPEFSSRIGWGVSVFHTFGHEAACQALYHPQKCPGFGCTDGEGCERCWASLQKLTGVLRVSGVCTLPLISPRTPCLSHLQFHQRIHILNQHIRYMTWNNFVNLGSWLQRKLDALFLKRHMARMRVESSGFTELALSLEWATLKDDAIQRAPSM